MDRISGSLTAQEYIGILQDVMFPSVTAVLVPEGEQFYFVQDNSPIHTTRIVRDWFMAHQTSQFAAAAQVTGSLLAKYHDRDYGMMIRIGNEYNMMVQQDLCDGAAKPV
ncbi:hypothetical protein Hamer_G016366 [Homarus americanus]|uniref:Tc1-like transposase DDE domain-containing protein n=1 Tax=Homarus americanus TaxID=6706 RepID=A0A8J5JP03_HOMAM|nr:hypothetical protein Hamer_G016366 [Homarus americanus]